MERLQSRRQRLSLLASGAIASLALSGCTGGEQNPSHDDGPVGASSRPDVTCTGAGLFTDYSNGDTVLKVHVYDSGNDPVEADGVTVRELETQRKRHLDLTNNETPVSISKQAVQVTVSVEVDDFRFSCPTIYYPNRRYEPPEYTPSNGQ